MKKGFTLSEVLLTLIIIGVISMLTIPTLLKNYKKNLYVVQLQKAYSQISQAAIEIMDDEHTDNFYETSAADGANQESTATGPYYFLDKYFKHSKISQSPSAGDLYAASYSSLDGQDAGRFSDYINCIKTKAGAVICVTYNSDVFHVWIDVNGKEEPNVAGRDAFIFNIDDDGSISDFGNKSCSACGTKSYSNGHIGDYSAGCLSCIIDADWKMEY